MKAWMLAAFATAMLVYAPASAQTPAKRTPITARQLTEFKAMFTPKMAVGVSNGGAQEGLVEPEYYQCIGPEVVRQFELRLRGQPTRGKILDVLGEVTGDNRCARRTGGAFALVHLLLDAGARNAGGN